MKLKKLFLTHSVGDDTMLVPVGAAARKFHGYVNCNPTAAFIVDCLKTDTTPEKIVDALAQEYEGDRGRMAASVTKTLEVLRSIGALDE